MTAPNQCLLPADKFIQGEYIVSYILQCKLSRMKAIDRGSVQNFTAPSHQDSILGMSFGLCIVLIIEVIPAKNS